MQGVERASGEPFGPRGALVRGSERGSDSRARLAEMPPALSERWPFTARRMPDREHLEHIAIDPIIDMVARLAGAEASEDFLCGDELGRIAAREADLQLLPLLRCQVPGFVLARREIDLGPFRKVRGLVNDEPAVPHTCANRQHGFQFSTIASIGPRARRLSEHETASDPGSG